VVERLTQLEEWGNLVRGRRETNARSIAEFAHGSVRYQVDKLALRIHREAERLLAAPEGVREVSRELLPVILEGLDAIAQTVSAAVAAEQLQGPTAAAVATLREKLRQQVTTLFLQHADLAGTVRDFYAYVGQVVARYDLKPEEILGFRGLLIEYIQLVVEDVLRHTEPIGEILTRLATALPELLRLLEPAKNLGPAVERSRGSSAQDWRELTEWFVDTQGRVSQVGALREATAKAIGALLANVKRATSSGGISPGRRAELIRLASSFDRATSDQAHRLYAESFGLSPARHWSAAPDADQTLATTSWQDGAKTVVEVSISSRGVRSARGRAAKVVANPVGEQAAIAEAEERAREAHAAYAELRAAAARLGGVTLSAAAFRVLYDLLRRALSHRDTVDSVGEFTHSPSRLRIKVGPLPHTVCRIHSTHGTLALHDVSVELTSVERSPRAAHAND
jgi:uncharacterized protein (TIGR02677 family)